MSPFLCHFSAGRTKKDGDWGGVDKVREGGRSSDTRYGVVTLGGGGATRGNGRDKVER